MIDNEYTIKHSIIKILIYIHDLKSRKGWLQNFYYDFSINEAGMSSMKSNVGGVLL